MDVLLRPRLLTAFAISLFAASAHAQDGEAAARVHFQAGTNYFQAEEYEAALAEYGRALELSGRAEFRDAALLHH